MCFSPSPPRPNAADAGRPGTRQRDVLTADLEARLQLVRERGYESMASLQVAA